MGALEAGAAGFAGADAAGFCPGVWAEARLATSNRLHRNRMRVKLDARMRKAPKKILYQEALRTGEEHGDAVFSMQRARSLKAREALARNFLDMANKKRNN